MTTLRQDAAHYRYLRDRGHLAHWIPTTAPAPRPKKAPAPSREIDRNIDRTRRRFP